MRMHASLRASALMVACSCLLALAACSGQNGGTSGNTGVASTSAIDPMFAEPRVGDLYAAELTHFSAYDFGGTGNDAYGMMRVVAVTDDRITVQTETGSWAERRGAIRELRGNHDLEGITWDENENIQISRSELPQLVDSGRILDVRRD